MSVRNKTLSGRLKRILHARAANWVKRRQGMDSFPVRIDKRRLYILPTRAGTAFATLLFIMLIAGLNYSNNIALFFTFLLAGFALVAMQQCHRNLLHVTLGGIVATPAFAGEIARLRMSLGNETMLSRLQIEASVTAEAFATADLPARSVQWLELPLATTQRGVLKIDRVKISTTFPYGLFRAWTWVHIPIEAIVYPRPVGKLPVPAQSGRRSGLRSQVGSGTEEWLGLRPFRDGDSPRQVAWKAYARGAPLLVKEYSSAGSELRIFEFSLLTSLTTEERLEQLARWIVDAEAQSERYGLVIGLQRFAPDRGPEHRHRCLSALALHDLEPHK